MKIDRIILASILAVVALVGGVAAVKQSKQVRPPHTVVAKQTAYDDEGLPHFSTIIHRVSADGVCHETQVMEDGKVHQHEFQLYGPFTKRQATPDMPEHLGVKYFEENNADVATWVSPDIQDYLRIATKKPDGSPRVIIEAVNVSRP